MLKCFLNILIDKSKQNGIVTLHLWAWTHVYQHLSLFIRWQWRAPRDLSHFVCCCFVCVVRSSISRGIKTTLFALFRARQIPNKTDGRKYIASVFRCSVCDLRPPPFFFWFLVASARIESRRKFLCSVCSTPSIVHTARQQHCNPWSHIIFATYMWIVLMILEESLGSQHRLSAASMMVHNNSELITVSGASAHAKSHTDVLYR